MRLLKRASLAACALLLSGTVTTAIADPLLVTGGHIQVSPFATDFIFQTTGPMFMGEREGTFPNTPLFSGAPGDTVNLSSSITTQLSGFTLNGTNMAGSVQFAFTAGDATVPPVDLVNGAWASAPFTFTGHLTVWATHALMTAGTPPLIEFDLFGNGTSQALFGVQRTPLGEPLLNEPLVAYSVINRFAAQAAPVPEPGTIALLIGGLASAVARRRLARRA